MHSTKRGHVQPRSVQVVLPEVPCGFGVLRGEATVKQDVVGPHQVRVWEVEGKRHLHGELGVAEHKGGCLCTPGLEGDLGLLDKDVEGIHVLLQETCFFFTSIN